MWNRDPDRRRRLLLHRKEIDFLDGKLRNRGYALVPLFINPRDGLLVTSGLMSADFARELRASYGAFLSCIVAITLNAGAYVSEIFRAGIQSIDKGQMEASRALGMPWWKTMRKVILPQAFRRILPPLGNNAIAFSCFLE